MKKGKWIRIINMEGEPQYGDETPIYKNFTEWRSPFRFKVNLNAR